MNSPLATGGQVVQMVRDFDFGRGHLQYFGVALHLCKHVLESENVNLCWGTKYDTQNPYLILHARVTGVPADHRHLFGKGGGRQRHGTRDFLQPQVARKPAHRGDQWNFTLFQPGQGVRQEHRGGGFVVGREANAATPARYPGVVGDDDGFANQLRGGVPERDQGGA